MAATEDAAPLMPFYYDDDRPWLRRKLDGIASHLYWRTSLGARGVFMATLWNVLLAPLWMIVDWWERMRRISLPVSAANLALGLPALAGMVAAWWIGTSAARLEPQELVRRHALRAQVSRSAGDRANELLALRRMREIDPTPEATLRLAQAFTESGEHGKALALMRELTPADDVGAPAAHRWFARRYLEDYAYPRAGDHARAHLTLALQSSGQSLAEQSETLVMLGKLELRERRPERAEEAFKQAVELKNPVGALELGWLRRWRGRAVDARDLGALALRYYDESTRLSADDQVAKALQTQAKALAGETGQAAATLAALADGAVSRDAQAAVAESCLRVGLLAPGPADRWRIWMTAFRMDPLAAPVLQHLVEAVARQPAEWAYFERGLQGLRGHDAGAAPAELLLGLTALNQGNAGAAANHLQRAAALDPAAPKLLATIARRAGLAPAAMLGWAEAGLKAWPNEPELQYLRGLARFAEGRHREAARDLDAVKALRDNDPAYHSLMADLYESLELADRADEHRRQAGGFAPRTQGASIDGRTNR